jgi:hypothetical protein
VAQRPETLVERGAHEPSGTTPSGSAPRSRTESPSNLDAALRVQMRSEIAQVRSGDEVGTVVDTERMHFFDPVTGTAIRD